MPLQFTHIITEEEAKLSQSKWITFAADHRTKSKITLVWTVIAKDGHFVLGKVKWYAAWRKYCFFPYMSTVFEQDCLRDISNFIEGQTKLHREKRKAEKLQKLEEQKTKTGYGLYF